MKRRFKIENLGCSSCAARMESQMLGLPGVRGASINMENGVLTLEDEGATAVDALRRITASIEPGTDVRAFDDAEDEKHTPRCACGHEHGHNHADGDAGLGKKLDKTRRELAGIAVAGAAFAAALLFGDRLTESFGPWGETAAYAAAYSLAAYPVLLTASRTLFTRSFLNEFFLMSFASLAAIAIGKFPEAVSVMLFYRIGEFFQELAANKSRRSIQALIEQKPGRARILRDGVEAEIGPESVARGDTVIVRPGEKIPVDGVVLSGLSRIDTSSLTGESRPVSVSAGSQVYGGTINTDGLLTIEASGGYKDSSVARILEMVEDAVARKSPTERFITTFARYYTPAVVGLAALVAVIPPLLSLGAFTAWFYRALVLLVISCPCALVISIPLGYFGGIGAASRLGILVKGGSVFDALQNVEAIFFDKTGTLTKGVFEVTAVRPAPGATEDELGLAAALAEHASNHPVARSIEEKFAHLLPSGIQIDAHTHEAHEKPGKGIAATVSLDGKATRLLTGSAALMTENGVRGFQPLESPLTVVYVARDERFLGSITVSDIVRPDAAQAVRGIRAAGIENICMLTGDREAVAASVADELGLSGYRAGLMPDEKVRAIESLSADKSRVAFVGDGVNDAPVLASAGVGIAMGGLGSEVAIEISDAVILDDSPGKVADLLRVARKTRRVVWQNIVAAMSVKGFFMILGIFGVAGLWEAIFADVGVALLAVLNATRTIRA